MRVIESDPIIDVFLCAVRMGKPMEVKMTESLYYHPQGNVIHQTLDHETVIINLDNGRYYSFNAPASFIWECLMKLYAVHEIADCFARRGNGDASELSQAIATFVAELVNEELIVAAPNAAHDREVLEIADVFFETPQMEKFTDMEKLIPLDPIHQVGAMGWPFPQANAK